MKYILVTGGVISGIGKGVIASSIGKILKTNGYEVTAIKIDPYINIDAGTFSPYEHGEVFVLDDGGEVDLDLGNYERFIDIKLHRDNNITTGKIYQSVINRERQGEFLGKTVQVVPHITDAIQEWVERVALKPVSNGGEPEICIIELGGTIGDIEGMPFVEAFRQFQFRVKKENFCCVHVSLVPQPKATNEHKTKPTQASVRELRGLGLSPDLIVCRSENPIDEVVKAKISNFCHVPPEQVVCLHDVKSVYHVPMFMEDQKLVEFFHERLQLPLRIHNLTEEGKHLSRKWRKLVQKMDHHIHEVNIAIVGKYTGLEDAYASVVKALQHATIECSVKLNIKFIAAGDLEPATLTNNAVRYHEAWQDLCKANGVIVPGGFGANGVEGKIAASEYARKNKIPYLAICFGFQIAVIEFARNVLGWEDADTYEISLDRSKRNVVIEMPEHHTGVMGGTMRLGKKLTMFKTDDSILRTLYKKDSIEERHRHRYEVDKVYVPDMERAGLKFVAEDESGERLEIFELQDHPYYVGVQFHPEYISRPLRPSPPYLGLILASCNKLRHVLDKGIVPQNDINLFSDEEVDDMETETEVSKVPSKAQKRSADLSWCQSVPPPVRIRTSEPNMGQSNIPMRMNIPQIPINQTVSNNVSTVSGGQNGDNAGNIGGNLSSTGIRLASVPALVSKPLAGQIHPNQGLFQNTQQKQAVSVANPIRSEPANTASVNQMMPSQGQTTSAPSSSGIPLQELTLWKGLVEFYDMTVQGKLVINTLACTVYSKMSYNDEFLVNGKKWPNKLCLQLVTRKHVAAANILPVLNNASKNVILHFTQDCETLIKLHRHMQCGKMGIVRFPTYMNIRVMSVLYIPNKNVFVGFIANDQEAFMKKADQMIADNNNEARKIIEQKQKMKLADKVPKS